MNRAKSEGDLGVLLPDSAVNSPSFDEGSSGGSAAGCISGSGSGSGSGLGLKKGPWTSAEDAILVEYVKNHGEGNWNAVQKNTGLARCGKSCRLRWANHLRPNLKKGAFSAEEEKLIIELHAKLGNKWARMAAYLPGRTDNEIKNYWNTRLKRCQRAGLPIYPSNVCYQLSTEDHQSLTEYSSSKKRSRDLLEESGFFIPDLTPEPYISTPPPDTLPYATATSLQDYPTGSIVNPGYGYCTYIYSTSTSPSPISALSEPLDLASSPETFRKVLEFSPNNNNNNNNNRNNNNNNYSYETMGCCHALLNGSNNNNFSASGPVAMPRPMKFELPSLQDTETGPITWLDQPAVGPASLRAESNNLSSLRNSGLLDALVHEAKVRSSGNGSESGMKSSGDSSWDLCLENMERSDDYDDSSVGVIGDNNGLLEDLLVCKEPEGLDAMLIRAPSPIQETTSPEREIPTLIRPDNLLCSDWFREKSSTVKHHSVVSEAISMFFGENICSQTKSINPSSGSNYAFGNTTLGLHSFS